MTRAWLGLVMGMGCWACGETEPASSNDPAAGQGGTEAGAPSNGGTGAAGGSGQGGTAQGGKSPGAGGVDGGEGGGTDEAGAGSGLADAGAGGDGTSGAAGSGGGEACNDLELIEADPTCTATPTPVTPLGGTVVEGTYTLVAYEQPVCTNGLEQTLRIEQTAPNTYRAETIINIAETRSTATLVRQGVILSSTSLCGASEVDEPNAYTAFEDQGVAHLRLINNGAFTYQRVGN